MRIGVFPQDQFGIQQESAHRFCGAKRCFLCARNHVTLIIKTSDIGRQPLDLRLNRYPSPSLRSGPPWARPPLISRDFVPISKGPKKVGVSKTSPAGFSKCLGKPKGLPEGGNTRGEPSCVLDLSLSVVWPRPRLPAVATIWPNKHSSAPVPGMPGQRSSGLTRRAVRSLGRRATSSIVRKTQESAKPQLTVSPVPTGVLIANRASCAVGFFRLSDAAPKRCGDLEGRPYV